MKQRKSWREKLADAKGLPKIGEVTGKMIQKWGKGRMVIPAPAEVDALMKKVPRGRLITINELRAALAARHNVDFAARSPLAFLPGSPRMPPLKILPQAKNGSLLTGEPSRPAA